MGIRDRWIGGGLFGVHWKRKQNQSMPSVVVSSRKAEGLLVTRIRSMVGWLKSLVGSDKRWFVVFEEIRALWWVNGKAGREVPLVAWYRRDGSARVAVIRGR